MPIYTEPDEPEFARLEARHRWFYNVLLADYGELPGAPEDIDPPDALNWLLFVPPDCRYDFEDVECGLAFVSADGTYSCTVWDVTGEEEEPWGVFVVDDYGPRLLAEYSIFEEEASEEQYEAALKRASDEVPERAEKGDFTRSGEPSVIPDWLMVEIVEDDEADED